MQEKSKGLLLQAIPYLGQKKILKVFTPNEGLLSLIVNAKTLSWRSLTTPFCIAEWVYQKGQKETHALKDGSLLDGLFELRQNYEALLAAGSMAQDLLQSQLPAKKAPDLYKLCIIYFKKLSSFSHPKALLASFRLKLLLHEGLLSLQRNCVLCSSPALHLFQGEGYCLDHAPFPGLTFTLEEWKALQILAFARQFSLLEKVEILPAEKISALFKERIQS